MLIPLKQFICDTCGQIIEDLEDGWVEWIDTNIDDKRVVKNFRICHHTMKCQKLAYHIGCSDNHLNSIIEIDPHTFIFSFIDIGPYHEREYKGPAIVDFRQYTDFMRRLTLPYYEEARKWWDKAISDSYFEDANEIIIYRPESLQKMIEDYSDQE